MDLINTSLSSYSDCEGEDGSGCHTPTLRGDLETWVQRGGIQREDFDAAKSIGHSGLVHYQVINHTLFRQQDCMFKFR